MAQVTYSHINTTVKVFSQAEQTTFSQHRYTLVKAYQQWHACYLQGLHCNTVKLPNFTKLQ